VKDEENHEKRGEGKKGKRDSEYQKNGGGGGRKERNKYKTKKRQGLAKWRMVVFRDQTLKFATKA